MELEPFECSTCQICLYGITNYQRHANSLEHANKVHLKNQENITDEAKVQDLSITTSKNACNINAAEPLSMSASIKCSNYYQCEPCQKQFTGIEPYQQHLVSAGHKKKLDISSNPSHLTGLLNCEICDKYFSGPAPYEQHMISKLHKKKVLAMKLKPKTNLFAFDDQCETGNKMESQNYNLQGNITQDSFGGFECNKNVSEYIPPEQHINSVHEKLRESEMFYNWTKDCSSESLLNKEKYVPFVHSIGPLKCEVCDKYFSGSVPYEQHMSSQIHKKKVQSKVFLKKLLSTDQTDCTRSNEEKSALYASNSENTYDFSNQLYSPSANQNGPFKCDLCDKYFSGSIPFDQHVNSANHKKKVQLHSENKNNQDFPMSYASKNEMPPSPWFCQVCDKQCSGAVPFKQHIISDAHCKKMRLAEMEENLKETEDLDSAKSTESVNVLSPERQLNSDIIYDDLFEDLNFATPESLNVTTFKANENIVFDITLK